MLQEARFTITYNGMPDRFEIDEQAFGRWVAQQGEDLGGIIPDWLDEAPGAAFAALVDEATETGVVRVPPGLTLCVYGDDEIDCSGFYDGLRNDGGGRVGLTSGWNDLKHVLRAAEKHASANPELVARECLDEVCAVADTILQVIDGLTDPRSDAVRTLPCPSPASAGQAGRLRTTQVSSPITTRGSLVSSANATPGRLGEDQQRQLREGSVPSARGRRLVRVARTSLATGGRVIGVQPGEHPMHRSNYWVCNRSICRLWAGFSTEHVTPSRNTRMWRRWCATTTPAARITPSQSTPREASWCSLHLRRPRGVPNRPRR